MDMQEPGEMCCCRCEEHDPAIAVSWKRWLLYAFANHIIISSLSITQAYQMRFPRCCTSPFFHPEQAH
jgi:hypothetical protein